MVEQKLADIIDRAIRREEEAYDFYVEILETVPDPAVKETILFIAGEEKKHKEFLENYRDGGYDADSFRMADVTYYKIAEHEKEPQVDAGMPREEIFLVAAHRELRSHKFYTELAEAYPEGKVKRMLLSMANEELKHKEKMEYLYANTAFPQTSGG